MNYYFKLLCKGIYEPGRVVRGLQSRWRDASTEVYLMSYPKAGRTWLRVMLNRALQQLAQVPEHRLLETYNISRRAGCRPTQFSHDGPFNLYHAGKADELRFRHRFYKSRRVVFLKRDLRDVLVSHFFEESRRMNTFGGELKQFLRDEVFGVRKLVNFHNMWFQNQGVPREFVLLSYEDLHRDPKAALRQVLAVMAAPELPDEALDEAIAYAAFGNLRRKEVAGTFRHGALQAGKTDDGESFKTRKGKVGGYREYLDDEDLTYIEAVVSAHGLPGCDWFYAAPENAPDAAR